MSIKKKYLKSKPVCKVTFKLDSDFVNDSTTASVVGDFNDWNPASNPMKALKAGGFSLTLDFPKGEEQQFRYFLGENEWGNEADADKQLATEFSDAQNSVLVL